jgi:peptidoglycan/xylan/chitin deacetylase (PgdA/CDA1 family)
MYAPLFKTIAIAGAAKRLSVLIFHRVHAQRDELFPAEPNAAEFELRMRWIANCFHVLPLAEALNCLREHRLPARALAITFDDGYADNHDVALPILRKLGLHATFFIATGFLNGGRMFNDSLIETVRRASGEHLDASMVGLNKLPLNNPAQRRAAIDALIGKIKYLPMAQRLDAVAQIAAAAGVRLPDDLMMSSAQVRALHQAGMGIGAHTVHHPILARAETNEAKDEIVAGRAALQDIIGERVGLFAYPNGRPDLDYRRQHVELVRELGFDAAVSTAMGAMSAADDFYQVPRFTPWNWHRMRASLLMARNLLSGPQALATL